MTQRLLLCLGEVQEAMEQAARIEEKKEQEMELLPSSSDVVRWIVKPSYANKGAEIAVVGSFEELQCHLLENHDLREWVRRSCGRVETLREF